MGAGVELTGNIIVDTVVISLVFTLACFTVVNGLPEALARANGGNLCFLLLACTGASLVVRAVIWVFKDG